MAEAKTAANLSQVTTDGEWETVVEEQGIQIDLSDPGDSFVGIYKGMRQVETEDLNNPGQKRTSNLYEFTGEDGKTYNLWGSHKLDSAFGYGDYAVEYPPNAGDTVRVTFTKKLEIDGGRRSLKDYRVQVKRAT